MKTSLYNHEISLEQGTRLLFNFYTLNLLALKPSEAEVASFLMGKPGEVPASRNASRLKKILTEKGFLIDDGVDERALLKASRFRAMSQTASLGLTIAPTVVCNFSCGYCYEGKKSRSMTPEVEDALIRFVQASIRKGGDLSIAWFGGEPLLALAVIKRLSEKLMKICDRASAKYSARIITNGYLLDKKAVKTLASLAVEEAQVTIDGPPEVHNLRRRLKNGGETYSRVLANVKDAMAAIPIILRMNVDQTNRDRIDEMLDILVKEGLHTKAGFHIGWTTPYTDACQDIAENCLTADDFSLLGMETMMKMIARGFTSAFGIPQRKDAVCLAENSRAFVIMPRGGIVNCWNEIDSPDAEIGHLWKPPTSRMEINARRWQEKNPFELECYDCRLLPICMGGCPYLLMKSGKLPCHPWKYNLDEGLALYYYLQVYSRQAKITRAFDEAVEAAKALKTGVSPKVD